MVKARAIRQAEVDERTAREEREKVNAEKEQYLRSTDWMVIREAERLLRLDYTRRGQDVPPEFDEREAAREAIVRDPERDDATKG